MTAEVFFDKSVLVYARTGDGRDDHKQRRAPELVESEDSGKRIERWTAFPCQVIDHQLVRVAIERSARYDISYWDAAILAAAESLGANIVYSEDLNDGQRYGRVRVVNPFSSSSRKPGRCRHAAGAPSDTLIASVRCQAAEHASGIRQTAEGARRSRPVVGEKLTRVFPLPGLRNWQPCTEVLMCDSEGKSLSTGEAPSGTELINGSTLTRSRPCPICSPPGRSPAEGVRRCNAAFQRCGVQARTSLALMPHITIMGHQDA
jgi:predicted nucleic acid-binding protein